MATRTDEYLFLLGASQFHLFMALWTSRVCHPGKSFPIATFTVRTDQTLPMLVVHPHQLFPTIRTFLIRQIIMLKRLFLTLNLIDNLPGITPHLLNELLTIQFTVFNRLEIFLPFSRQKRTFKILRSQVQ